MVHSKADKTVQMVQSSHIGYNMMSTVQILLLIEYIIFNASFKQAETEGLHIMREVIPYFLGPDSEECVAGYVFYRRQYAAYNVGV